MRFAGCALLLAALAQARDVTEDWDITYVTTNRGLDQTPKRGIGVNGAFPLPVVEAEIGDTLVLNVHNSLDVPTSLHAHGLHQRGTNYYDGVQFTTECGIAPGANFTYRIPLEQSGTYWIHGHTMEQNYDGLRTPLVIRDPKDPYPADADEYLFAVEDWWPITIEETIDILHIPGNPVLPFETPPGTLINGGPGNRTGPIRFEPGKTHRIRLVSMMSLPLWEFAIDDHQLQIIEVDGAATKPKVVDVVRMAPGQRVSVLVTAKASAAENYQYHITVLQEYVPAIPGVYPAQFDGSVVYSPNAPMHVAAAIPTGPLSELDMESLDYEPAMVPDRALFVNITAGYSPAAVLDESLSLITYRNPLVPSVFSALTTGERAINPVTYGPQTNAHVVKYGEVVEVLLWSPAEFPHPMHLHGYSFQIVETGRVNDTTGEHTRRVPAQNFSPLKRDTVLVPTGEYVVVRFRADNPGAWIMHCHFDWHMALGMNMLFVVAPREMQRTLRVPPEVGEQCRRQGIKTSGNAAGNNGYDYRPAPELPELLANSPGLTKCALSPARAGSGAYIYETIRLGQGLAVSTSSLEVRVYERFGAAPVRTIKHHTGQITQIRARENSLLSSSLDGQIAVWDVRQAGSAPSMVFRSSDPVLSFDLSADDTVLVGGTQLNSDYAAKVLFWDPRAPGAPVRAFEDSHSDDVTQIQCSPSAPKRLLSGSTDGLVCTFDLGQPDEDDALQYVANTGASVARCGYFGPESQFIYAQSDMETLQLWTSEATRLADFGDVRGLSQSGVPVDYIVKCEYNAASQRLYMVAGTNDGDIQLLHVGAASMEHIQRLSSGHSGVVRGFAWDLDAGWAASGGEDGCLAWWSRASQAQPAAAGPGPSRSPGTAAAGASSRRFAPY
ncbi:ferroxidase fet3 [Coemansia javaensis]|uniref:Ferroxidase fet3 n=1 Tax=Coemansia javaensis TaxID=2761396 RepID=A0A9W8HH64_9FUNG|nr:ferroxidase fet3 [Coemansia javaensis]